MFHVDRAAQAPAGDDEQIAPGLGAKTQRIGGAGGRLRGFVLDEQPQALGSVHHSDVQPGCVRPLHRGAPYQGDQVGGGRRDPVGHRPGRADFGDHGLHAGVAGLDPAVLAEQSGQ